MQFISRGKHPINEPPFYVEAERDGIQVEVSVQYNEGYNDNVFSFANNIHTHEGGTHLSGFRGALTRTLNSYVQRENKNGKTSLTGEDVREGLTAVVSVKLAEPQFEGQTKSKLGNSEVRSIVESVMGGRFADYLEENPDAA